MEMFIWGMLAGLGLAAIMFVLWDSQKQAEDFDDPVIVCQPRLEICLQMPNGSYTTFNVLFTDQEDAQGKLNLFKLHDILSAKVWDPSTAKYLAKMDTDGVLRALF